MHQVYGRSGEGNKDVRRVTGPIMRGGRVRVEQVCGRSGEGN